MKLVTLTPVTVGYHATDWVEVLYLSLQQRCCPCMDFIIPYPDDDPSSGPLHDSECSATYFLTPAAFFSINACSEALVFGTFVYAAMRVFRGDRGRQGAATRRVKMAKTMVSTTMRFERTISVIGVNMSFLIFK